MNAKTSRTAAILVAGLMLAALLFGSVWVARAATMRLVAPGGIDTGDCSVTACATINYAISQAVAGDTISVAAGTYVENILIDKSLELFGAGMGSTIIVPAVSNPNPCTGSSLCGTITSSSNVIGVQANNVTIHDLTVDGDNLGLTSGKLRGGADLDARNGIITNHPAGVFNNLEVHHVEVKNIYLRGMYASSGGSFNFHHNTVTNVQGDGGSIAMFAWYGPGIMANNTVSYANDGISANHSKGIQFLNNAVSNSGSGVHTDNAGDSAGSVADLLQGNTVTCSDPTAYGVWVFVPYIAPTVTENTVLDCGVGLSAWAQGAAVTPIFTKNVVDGPAKAGGSVGVYITTDLISWGYSDISVSFSNNIITDNETGLYFTADQQTWNPYPYVAKTINATFADNSIYDNTYGADKGTTGTYNLNASGNWWGASDAAAVKAAVNGGDGIDYTPWLASGTDTDLVTPGFQGDFSALWVDDDSPQTGSTGRIQEGINLVSGSTVNVAAGTYSEPLDIDSKADLTISGVDKTQVLIKPTSVLSWNACNQTTGRKVAIRVVNSTNFTLEQVTLDMDLVKANLTFGLLVCNSTGVMQDNIVKNLSLPDASGGYYELGMDITAPGYTSSSRAPFTVDSNTFIDTGRVGVVTHFYVDATINGNTFYKTTDDFGYAMEIGGPSIANISNNVIYNYDTPALSDGSNSAGIYIENSFTSAITSPAVTKNVILDDNEVYNSQWGVYIGNEFNGYAGNVDIVVSGGGNNFHDNVEGAVYITDEDKSAGSSVNVSLTDDTLTNNGGYGYFITTVGDGDPTVALANQTITGHAVGVFLNDTDASPPSGSSYNVSIHQSNLSGNTSYGVQNSYAGTVIDAENNWWGSACGPTGAGASAASADVDYSPWWITLTGTGTASGDPIPGGPGYEWMVPAGSSTAQSQTIIDCAMPGDAVKFESGSYDGGLFLNTNTITVTLNATTVGPGSPAFTINGDDVIVLGPGLLDGSANASPAILVNGGADNFTLEDVEVKNWANGVELAGSVTSFKLLDNWIHNNANHGLLVDAGVSVGGVVTIQGNLFKDNTGNGVQNNGATTNLNVQYNSWGDIDGAAVGTGGDGIGGSVDAGNPTFSEVYLDMAPDVLATVRNVNEDAAFTVKVKVDAAHLYAAQYKLTYDPAILTLQSASDGSFKGSGACYLDTATPGVVTAFCTRFLPDAEADLPEYTITNLNFVADLTGVSPMLSGPWTTYMDLSTNVADLSSGAKGGIKVFVNNGGFGADSGLPGHTITDAQDGQVNVSGLANFTGFIDLEGRANDSGATLTAYNQALISGSLAYASGTSASSGRFTTAYLGGYQLTVPTSYFFKVDAPLYLPTTALGVTPSFPTLSTSWLNGDVLADRPLTSLLLVKLLGGDANDDNIIDASDLTCIGGAYGGAAAPCGLGTSDVNGDGIVNIYDLVLLGGNYDKTSSGWLQVP